MSLEDDYDGLSDRLSRKMVEAMRAMQAGQPDTLVFCLRGSEIQKLLNDRADAEDREAESVELPENVVQMRASHVSAPVFPGQAKEFEAAARMRAAAAAQVKYLVDGHRDNARSLRFLAAHVEEDRYFKLAQHDLALLGLLPPMMSYARPMSILSQGPIA
jgi:hypothetical protein